MRQCIWISIGIIVLLSLIFGLIGVSRNSFVTETDGTTEDDKDRKEN